MFSLILLSALSCKDSRYHQKGEVVTSSDLKAALQGVWAENENENSLFEIVGDSIADADHDERFLFALNGDTLVVDYGDFTGRYIILEHTIDSLIIKNEDGSVLRLKKRLE